MELHERVLANRIKLQKEKPFFAYLILNLKIKEFDKKTKDLMKIMGMPLSACIDAYGNLHYNKDWFNKLDDEQMKFVLCHEVLHNALLHLIRKGRRVYEEIYRLAVDLAVNNILVNDGMTSPKEGLIPYNNIYEFKDEKGKAIKGKKGKPIVIDRLDKKSYEQIYDEIKRKLNKKQLKNMKGFDGHIIAVVGDNDGDGKDKKENKGKGTGKIIKISQKEYDKISKKWKKAIVTAAAHCKQRGEIPAGMQRMIDELLDAKVNWKHMLQKYISSMIPVDYSYTFPSKRSISTGFYMPHLLREMLEVVVAVDTSGSISQKELTEFLSECISIAKSFVNLRMTMIICDCNISDIIEVTNGNIQKIMDLKIKGGGGTSHKPIYSHIKENMANTKILINFTDGYTEFPDKKEVPYNLNSLWVITSDGCNINEIPNYLGERIKLD